MARAQDISRLHQAGAELPNFGNAKAGDERIKSKDFLNLPTAVAVHPRPRRTRGRFAMHAEVESYAVAAPDILALMEPASEMDRAGAFSELAERERLAQIVRRHLAARGIQRDRVDPMIRA